MFIKPNYIEEGKYTGGGFCFTGLSKPNRSSFDCSLDIKVSRDSVLVSGYYQYPSTGDRRRFSASLCEHNISDLSSVKTPTIGAFDLNDDTLGELTGILSTSGMSMLVQASSEDGEIQISQRLDPLRNDNCFHVHGIVVRTGSPPIHYSLTVGKIESRSAKSNAIVIGDLVKSS